MALTLFSYKLIKCQRESPAATIKMDNTIPTNEKAVGVVITKTKTDGILTYDAVRRSWLLSDEQLAKANEARYVLAIENGTVVDIFEKHGDFRPSSDDAENKGRYTFSPVPVTDSAVRNRYIGAHYCSYGSAVIFFGF